MIKNTEKKAKSWIKRRKLSIIAIIIIGIIVILAFGGDEKSTVSQFATVTVSRGNISHVVTATGEIQPVNTVNIGSQVSGKIEKIYVDYNSKVKKGDVLLTIDPSVLKASSEESKASLVSAEAQRNYAKKDYERNKTLYNDGFIARADLEQSETTYETSQQSVKRAQSEYNRAVTNLGYATIVSPVNGTVISRKVDTGQTIAASLQSPDLFEIAEDLSKMQIETSVSEADIGVIKEKQTVNFTVDAYPTKTFEGLVRQIRLSPTTTSNVVVYTVVIDVDNSDLSLMPGMTAFVTIMISEKKNVLKASNSAFLLTDFDGITENAGDKKPSDYLAIQISDKNKTDVKFVPYKKGLVTATESEIISDVIKEGDLIITGKTGLANTKARGMSGGGPR